MGTTAQPKPSEQPQHSTAVEPQNWRQRLHHKTSDVFGVWGRFVGKHPILVVVLSIVLSLLLSCCLYLLELESDATELFSVSDTHGYKDYHKLEDIFGNEPINSGFGLDANDGRSALLKANLEKVLAFENTILNDLKVTVDGKLIGFEDICVRYYYPDGPCKTDSLLLRMVNRNAQALAAMSQEDIFAYVENHQSELETRVARIQKDADGHVIGASGIDFGIVEPVHKGSKRLFGVTKTFADRAQRAWERRAIDDALDQPLEEYTINPYLGRSLEDELIANIFNSIVFVFLSVVLVFVFGVIVMSGKPPHKSRLLLAMSLPVCVLLALLSGHGLMAATGTPVSFLNVLLAFVISGVSIDDAVIILAFFDAEPQSEPVVERMSKAFSGAGVTVLLTSFTSAVAFAGSAYVDFLAAKLFCIGGFFCVVTLWALVCSLFAGCVVLDANAKAKNRLDCLPCVPICERSRKDPTAPRGATISPALIAQQLINQFLNPLFRKRWFVVGIFIVWLALGILCAVSINSIPIGIPLEDNFAADSYVRAGILRTQKQFGGGTGYSLYVVTENEDLSDPQIQTKLLSMYAELEALPQVKSMWCWLPLFLAYQQQNATSAALPFDTAVQEFMSRTTPTVIQGVVVVPAIFSIQVVFNDDGSIKAARCAAPFAWSSNVDDRIVQMDETRDVFNSYGLNGFVISWGWIFSDRDKVMTRLLLGNLGTALVSVFVAISIWLEFSMSILVIICLVFVDLALLGEMWALGIPIDGISFMSLVMGVGFSVDYLIHIAHAYSMHTKRSSPVVSRVQHAVQEMGSSVLQGGLSTLVGVIALSGVTTVLFVIFFKLLVGIILLGVLSGMLILPCLLVLLNHFSGFVRAPRLATSVSTNSPAPTQVQLANTFMPPDHAVPTFASTNSLPATPAILRASSDDKIQPST